MKKHPSPVSGVALVIVLGFLVLISVLAVAFFTSVTTEVKASRNFASGITTRQLNDSAVQIVMGQIADATTRGINAAGLGTEAWASQPGMIRVFSASGAPDAYYLLYSYDDMVKTAATTNLGTWDPMQDLLSANENGQKWDTIPGVWTDLNAPIMVWDPVSAAEIPRFPIIDPRAFSDSSISSSTPAPTTDYPGSAWKASQVEGFYYDTSAGVDGVVPPKGTNASTANQQRLPMPVRWIYVLQDGTLTTPTSWQAGTGAPGSVSTATFTTNAPTQANPIVGRMAFWTDDETSKLNLNTAAGYINDPSQLPAGYNVTNYAGSFWDTPRYYTTFDYGIPYYNGGSGPPGTPQPGGGGLALCQLLQNEFQRYPGHPATTSLMPALGRVLMNDNNAAGINFVSNQLYGLTPRYSTLDMNNQPGTTNGGTQRIIVDDSGAGTRTTQGQTGSAATQGTDGLSNSVDNREIQPKQDRLYASVDELLYGAHAGGMNNPSVTDQSASYVRLVNDAYTKPSLNNGSNTPTVLTPQVIDSLRAFLTTQSRAPDLNLWGQPRVTAWPVRAETATEIPSGMNVFDNLILFCSTIGLNPAPSSSGRPDTSDQSATGGAEAITSGQFRYMFTRREIDKTTGTPPSIQPAPGFSTTYDCELPRNKYLLGTYLYNFLNGTNGPIPGFGYNWSSKYGAPDQQSILLEIFDYVRCANSQDTTTSLTSGQPIKFAPQGFIQPSVPQDYFSGVKGAGRMSTICEVTLDFYYAGPVMYTKTGSGVTLPEGGSAASNLTNTGWSRWDPITPKARYVQETSGNPATPAAPWYSSNYMRAFLLFSTFDPMEGYAPKADPVSAGVNNINSPLTSIPASPQLAIQAGWVSTGGSTPADPTVSFYVANVLNSATTNMNWYNGSQGLLADPAMPTVNGFQAPYTTVNRAPGSYWGGRNYGGYEGFMHTLMGPGSSTTNSKPTYPGLEKIAWAPTRVNLGSGLSPYLTPGTGTDFGETLYPPAVGNTAWTAGTPAPVINQFTAVPTTGQEFYPFQTMNLPSPAFNYPAMAVPYNATGFNFNGGTLKVVLYYGGIAASNALQSFTVTFPKTNVSGGWPLPEGGVGYQPDGVSAIIQPMQTGKTVAGSADVYTWCSAVDTGNVGGVGASGSNPGSAGMALWYWRGDGSFFLNNLATLSTKSNYKYRTSLQAAWSFPTRLAWVTGTSLGFNSWTSSYFDVNGLSDDPSYNQSGNSEPIEYDGNRWQCIVQPGDTIRSMLYWGSSGSALSGVGTINAGDLRVGQLETSVPSTSFAAHPDYQTGNSRACCLRGGDGNFYFPIGTSPASHLATSGNMANEATLGNQIYLGSSNTEKVNSAGAFGNLPWGGGATGNIKAAVNGVMRNDGKPGDWDNGAGAFPDGPFLNKQDEGNVIYRYYDSWDQVWIYPIPYFSFTQSYQVPGNSFTSPARQMPSPVMFGSLPAHVIGSGSTSSPQPHQWETLCFSPNPAGSSHPGNADPKDHLLLDLFTMPVVEPYPISEPFSTAGRVNLNYRIAPFDYIRRSTALRGALMSIRVSVVPSQYANGGSTPDYLYYKTGVPNPTGVIPPGYSAAPPTPLSTNFRKLVDRDQTITEMDSVYNTPGGFFKSASQLCEMFLIPWNSSAPTMSNSANASITEQSNPGPNITAMVNWWKSPAIGEGGQANGDLTGDNEREKPYADLYPRITTKSNTYTVHVKVQTLRQLPRVATTGGTSQNSWATWNEGKDVILAEYRGSSTIERYLQPDDPRIGTGNYAGASQVNPDLQSLEPLYRFRTLITKKFSP